MADPQERGIEQQLIVKVDEVDQTGTAIQPPSRLLPLSALSPIDGQAATATRRAQEKANSGLPIRPGLRRDSSTPLPPSQLLSPAPFQGPNPEDPADSLSLPQLRQLVSQFPKIEQRAYAFQYADAQTFSDEINEWFQYTEQDRGLVLNSRDSFEHRWRPFSTGRRELADNEPSWLDVDMQTRTAFVASLIPDLMEGSFIVRIEAMECLTYLLCGVWGHTAGLEMTADLHNDLSGTGDDRSPYNAIQVEWMHKGAALLSQDTILGNLYIVTRRAFAPEECVSDLTLSLIR